MASVVDKVLRVGEGHQLKKLADIARRTNALEPDIKKLSDEELKAKTPEFKKRIENGESLDKMMPEAFAVVREAAYRVVGQRPYDVQLMGGAALHLGNIAEMKTGEGKTLVAALPSYLNALTGKGVHVVTVNDYLANYQSDLMGRIHRFLGLTVGCIITDQQPAERKKQYEADITYGTNNEFGFDYLRDNMAWDKNDLVQRGHAYAIVDEVDSILIDEARTPLIISGPAEGDVTRWYRQFARMVPGLTRDVDYEIDEKKKTVGILDPGIEKIEDYLGIDNLYLPQNTALIGYINNAIKAKELFARDKDYVVKGDEVLIVDEHTGRVLSGRRYNEGLHQALEAKENVKIQAENQTFATITLQNYFRMYKKLSGMTGTAETEAAEFMNTYKLGVIPIPTNKPVIRKDMPDVIYRTKNEKLAAIVQDVAERYAKGQPVLLGTASVEASEVISSLLDIAGIPHAVLNAKQHEQEAAVVAVAGRRNMVTVATNMAGRGTDIMLGGNVEFLADQELRKNGYSPETTPDEYNELWNPTLEKVKEQVKAEHEEVVNLGGLYVLGTERHESRRIDNQLRGRSGRQGDPGESRFYLSLEDDLMRLFNTELVGRIMATSFDPGQPIESKQVSKGVFNAQKAVESRNYEIRKNVLKYDDVMNKQREVIYRERQSVLEGDDLSEDISEFLDQTLNSYVQEVTRQAEKPAKWDIENLWNATASIFIPTISPQEAHEQVDKMGHDAAQKKLLEILKTQAVARYKEREEELTPRLMRDLERRVVLAVLDRKWREHLYEMDYLKDGIGLRGIGQRDPLVEYQREGYQMYNSMVEGIKEESVQLLFNIDFTQAELAEDAEAALEKEAVAHGPEDLETVNEDLDEERAAQESIEQEVQLEREEEMSVSAAANADEEGVNPDTVSEPTTSFGNMTSDESFSAASETSSQDSASQEKEEAGDSSQENIAENASKESNSRPGSIVGPEPLSHADKKVRVARDMSVIQSSVPWSDGRTFPGTPRNAPCPCGSGRKYKMCHGQNEK